MPLIYRMRSSSYLYHKPPIMFCLGQAYQAIINGRGQPHSAAVQRPYPDWSFLHGLEVTGHQWLDLLSDAGLSTSMSNHTPLTYITYEVTPLAEQGDIEFYRLPDLDKFQHWVRKEQAYNFICSVEPHPMEPRPPETFNTQADADAFLDQFDLDNSYWVYFLSQHRPVLKQLYAAKRVPVLMLSDLQEFDLRPVIAEMLLNEEIRVYTEPDPWRWHTPPKKRAEPEVTEVPVRNPPPMAPPSPLPESPPDPKPLLSSREKEDNESEVPNSDILEGITFEGTIYRATNPKYADDAWRIHAGNISANHRYSSPGRGALYSGTSPEAVLGELKHYNANLDNVVFLEHQVNVDNILDLTNPSIRNQLGVDLSDLTRGSQDSFDLHRTIGDPNNDYFITHSLGDFAQPRYKGILAPSAREPGTSHLILFESLKKDGL